MNQATDIINKVNVPPFKKARIQQWMNDIVEEYSTKNNIPLDELIELDELALSVFDYDVEYKNIKENYPVLKNCSSDILGCTDFENKIIVIDVDSFNKNPKRANFTLAHEITHIRLHEKYYHRFIESNKIQLSIGSINKKDSPHFVCRDYANQEKPLIEKQADLGASFLLIRKPLLERIWLEIKPQYTTWLSKELKPNEYSLIIGTLAEDLTDKLNISKQALRIGLENIGLETFGFFLEGGGKQLSLL